MIFDLHNHSIKSDDGRAKVENYCQWIRSRDLPIDGIALTKHRQFEPTDYSSLERKFDFVWTDSPLSKALAAIEKHGAIAAPAYPGRKQVGMFAHTVTLGVPDGTRIVEVYNGGRRTHEEQVTI